MLQQTDDSHDTTEPASLAPKGASPRRWRRRLAWTAATILALDLIVLGPWPADNSSYRDSAYYERTRQALELATVQAERTGVLRIGVAETDISPAPGHPLAGFSQRHPNSFEAIDSKCSARALTVAVNETAVTILTADLLLINAKLAQAVITRTGLSADQIYFTATHTHNGPGGWGDHPLEQLIAGRYDPEFATALADSLADVVRRSRRELEPAELAVVTCPADDHQRNRIDRASTTHGTLSALVFRRINSASKSGRPTAILTVYAAHATVAGASCRNLSADYPGALVERLQQRTGAEAAMFAAGAGGDAAPCPQAGSPTTRVEQYGHALADRLVDCLENPDYDQRVTMANMRLELELPPLRVPLGSSWRLSPVCTTWIADRRTHIHVLQIGRAVLVGMPGDYSGELADRLAVRAQDHGLELIATGFNGDWKSYLVSSDTFRSRSAYETRTMNFFGPWTGDYLTELAGSMIDRIRSANMSLAQAR